MLEIVILSKSAIVSVVLVNQTNQCCDMDQSDTVGKIELIPSFVLSSKCANSRNDIQLFSQLFDEQE